MAREDALRKRDDGRPSVVILSQHSIGIGHLSRVSALAMALRDEARVTIISGGRPPRAYRPPTGVQFVQLPAVYWMRGSHDYPKPVDPVEDPARVFRRRAEMVLEIVERERPRLLLFEFYPFEPNRFAGALDLMLGRLADQPEPPVCISSIRAVPITNSPGVHSDPTESRRLLERHFKAVLHHADPRVFALSELESYLKDSLGEVPLIQTGHVRRYGEAPTAAGMQDALLLTVGAGGRPGARLLHKLLDAAALARRAPTHLHVVCGPFTPECDLATLKARATDRIVVHDALPHLDDLIGRCRAVVSMGGYNTIVEALSAGRPLLSFPRTETEQRTMVGSFARAGLLMRGDAEADVETVAHQIDRLMDFRPAFQLDCDGARRTMEFVRPFLV